MTTVWRRADSVLARMPQGARAAFVISILAAIGVIDLVTGDHTHFNEMTVLAPALASALCSVRWTGAIAVAAVAAFLAQSWALGTAYGTEMPVLLTMIVAACVVSVVVAGVRASRERELARARVTIEVLQRTMLHKLPMTAGPLEVHGFYVAAEADALVGGDIYEAVRTPFGVRLLIGDVCGKGLRAIHAASDVLSSFREAAHHQPTIEELAVRLEQAVARHNSQAGEDDDEPRFVTALLVEVGRDGRTRVANCGHVAPYVIRGGKASEVGGAEPALPLGLGDLSDEPRLSVPLDFGPGDALLLCTDGVTEARGPNGAFYPLGERLAEWADRKPEEIAELLRTDLVRYAAGGAQRDDATLLVIRQL
jgi:serine phosphatase RsbU (regulator of sigma subunit)